MTALVVGAGAPRRTSTDFAIGAGALIALVLPLIFRRIIQDEEHVHFREPTPAPPEEEAAALGDEPTPPAALPA
jgi:hypothetical protein